MGRAASTAADAPLGEMLIAWVCREQTDFQNTESLFLPIHLHLGSFLCYFHLVPFIPSLAPAHQLDSLAIHPSCLLENPWHMLLTLSA